MASEDLEAAHCQTAEDLASRQLFFHLSADLQHKALPHAALHRSGMLAERAGRAGLSHCFPFDEVLQQEQDLGHYGEIRLCPDRICSLPDPQGAGALGHRPKRNREAAV